MRLARLTSALGQMRPAWFGALYLAAIPCYATLYYTLGGFYAPYARLEPHAQADSEKVALMLKQAIHRSLESRNLHEFVLGNTTIGLDSFFLDGVQALEDNSGISFDLRFTEKDTYWMGWGTTVKMTGGSKVTYKSCIVNHSCTKDDLDATTVTHFVVPDFRSQRFPLEHSYNKLFDLIFVEDTDRQGTKEHALVLRWQEEPILQRYRAGIAGVSSDISGSLERMLYLSVVVITTLGLGDIVPMTAVSRLLVASEAITGILLAGLFLNSLATRVSSSG
jgi:hypothetical protein